MVDYLGQPMKVGDKVAYGARRGNTAEVRTGTVVSLTSASYCRTVVIRSDRDAEAHRPCNQVIVLPKQHEPTL
jgi:hypothetical protein